MSMQGDDCYFFYYSTCTKGDSCPFRHCEAAMGCETVCTLWQEKRCFRSVCKFRHMEIKKNRKEIPCYWENQAAGCQKPHCAFHHEKSRIINGTYYPPDKGQVLRKEEEVPHDGQANQVPAPSADLPNPQPKGVIKTRETQESVPSPTHPPVVINPVDDDDEDDQFSEEGDESPRKLMTSKNDSLNFGIQTLEEIKLRKCLMASLKRAGQSTKQGSDQNSGAAIEKENIQSFSRVEVNNANIDSPVNEIKGKITDRLGKRVFNRDVPVEEDLPLKRRLAERLGGIVKSSTDIQEIPPKKALKPVRERLGLNDDLDAIDTDSKSSEDIRIKTLEEIQKEKAARALKVARVVKEVPTKEPSPSKKSGKASGGPQVKTFSEILHEKKKMQQKKAQDVNASPEKNEGPSTARTAVKAPVSAGVVKVKTLEEIRREKAARTQALETASDETPTSSQEDSSEAPKKRILRVFKTSPATVTVNQAKPDASDKKLEPVAKANGKGDTSGETVKVKTFEEIMREKRLRKLQEEEGTSNVQKPAESSAPAASPPASEASTQNSVIQRISLKSKVSPVSAALVPQKRSPEPSEESTPSSKKLKPSTPVVKPVQLAEGTIQTVETKVKPKVNVKPSVVKPAAKPVQKRKTEVHHSAVAEVKPLNTPHQTPSSLVIPNKRLKASSPTPVTKVQSQQVPSSTDDVQKVPMLRPSKTTSEESENITVSQSSVIRTPSQPRARRSSTLCSRNPVPAAVSSSSLDFEDLLDEFTDDRFEDDLELDSGKGEDDLLLELSEMIDS